MFTRLVFIVAILIVNSFAKHNGIGPITDHFNNFLKSNGYATYDFPRVSMSDYGSFGGKLSNSDSIKHTPTIFMHGNSDAALTANSFSTGWTNTVHYFLNKGYSLSELYATSWGNTIAAEATLRKHDCKTLIRLRKFVEAVLAYTKADKINIIGHSMGVTLGRKIIAGGNVKDSKTHCNLGNSLASKVNVFIGLSGANRGLCSCIGDSEFYPTCNPVNGFWAGDFCGPKKSSMCGKDTLSPTCTSTAYSQYLMSLNAGETKISDKLFSAWSRDDELLGNQNYVWGNYTSLIPHSDGHKIYLGLTHMQTKENTAADQFYMITTGTIAK